jgi:hypothetical protein
MDWARQECGVDHWEPTRSDASTSRGGWYQFERDPRSAGFDLDRAGDGARLPIADTDC